MTKEQVIGAFLFMQIKRREAVMVMLDDKLSGLTQQQINCLELFLKLGNKTQAGIQAGYSKKTAAQSATRLINGPKGQAYLAKRREEMSNSVADADEVMEYLTKVMRGEVKDSYNKDAPLCERTRAANELAKRLIDSNKASNIDVKIVCDIPKPKRARPKTPKDKEVKQEEKPVS